MDISPNLLLAEIVDLVPGAPRVLDSFGLDYCCGGQHSLRAACERSGLGVGELIAALETLEDGPVPDWVPMGPALLVEHIETTHHAYLHAELPRIEALADKVADVHGGRHPELLELRRRCSELRADLEPHLAKEEQVLFPMIRELAASVAPPGGHGGSVVAPISMMMREHEHTGKLLEAIRDVTDGYRVPEDGCASYRALFEGLTALEADTHLHVHKENDVLFPAVVELEQRWATSA